MGVGRRGKGSQTREAGGDGEMECRAAVDVRDNGGVWWTRGISATAVVRRAAPEGGAEQVGHGGHKKHPLVRRAVLGLQE